MRLSDRVIDTAGKGLADGPDSTQDGCILGCSDLAAYRPTARRAQARISASGPAGRPDSAHNGTTTAA